MKNKLLLLALVAGSFSAFGQGGSTRTLGPRPVNVSSLTPKSADMLSMDREKTMLCRDTVRYPDAKEQVLGLGNYAAIDVWQSDVERFSQTFLLSGSSMNIHGVEIQAANNYFADPSGTASVTVRASIYNVNASYVPTTSLGNGTVTISSSTFGLYYINFASPITVSANYAIVLEATNANGIVSIIVNDDTPGQTYDENLSRFKSDYYPASSGSYVSIPVLTTNAADFEPLVGPIVTYNINTAFTVSQDPTCLGTPVTYTNTSTPASILSNRMFSFNYFLDYFNLAASDSTYAWDMDNGTYVWSSNHTYTYPTAGTYDPALIILGGFWNSCIDFATDNVVINAIPTAPTLTAGGPTTFCTGGSVTLNSSYASGNNWSNGGTNQSITVSAAGSYTATVTENGCTSPASAAMVVTVNPMDNASFAYSTNTFCTGGSNETPTITTPGGTFSSSPAGLALNPSTGEIDFGNSTNGTYVITYTTAGTCPNSSNVTVTITTAPDATFTYAQAAYCSADSDPTPSFGAGASGGVFTSTGGLSINGSGMIDLSASTAGTYTVTNSIAAAGVCPATSATFNVTINETPSAVVSGGGQMCGSGTIPVTVTLTGAGPWDITYTDGSNTMNLNGETASPVTINAAASGVYTVTNVTMGACSASGTGAATVQIDANPVVTLAGLSDVCENGSVVTLNATPAGGTFSGTGVSGTTFDPAAAGDGTFAIAYDYTDGNGCTGSASGNITVNPAPVVALAPLTDVCVYNASFTLTGGTPAGGTYSGTGVTAGSFDPATAGLGIQTITYSYTDANGCSDAAFQDIAVDECLGINELTDINLLIVPNPASDFITISYNSGDNSVSEIALLTSDGKIVSSRGVNTNELQETMNVNNLAEGMYFVRLTTEKGVITQKVIIR